MDRMHFSLHGMKNIVPWNFNQMHLKDMTLRKNQEAISKNI